MADGTAITAWIFLIFALYSIAAAIGEIRSPGGWAKMMWELEQSKALQFITGFMILVSGAAVYLVNPFDGTNWASILATVLGGWMIIEGIAFLAFPDWILRLGRKMIGSDSAIWAYCALAIGLALLILSYNCFPAD